VIFELLKCPYAGIYEYNPLLASIKAVLLPFPLIGVPDVPFVLIVI
jgi:hypothetical protein